MKKRIFLIGLLLASLFMVGLVNATQITDDWNCTVIWPNATVTTMNLTAGYNTLQVEINNTNATGIGNATITWYYTPVGGNEAVLIANATVFGNASVPNGPVNTSRTAFSPTAYSPLSDAVPYTITAKMYAQNDSSSDTETCASARTGIHFDRTKPVCTITAPVSNSQTEPEFTVTITATNASQVTLFVGSKTYNMTLKGGLGAEIATYSFDASDIADGMYSIVANASDTTVSAGKGGNGTVCRITNLEVYESPSPGRIAAIVRDKEEVQQEESTNRTKVILGLGGIATIWWLLSKK